jgi:hypothetical protein
MNDVELGYTFFGGYKYGDLALQFLGVSGVTVINIFLLVLHFLDQLMIALFTTEPSSRQRGLHA